MPIRTRRIVLAALWAVFLLPLASAFAQTGDTRADSDALAEAIRQHSDDPARDLAELFGRPALVRMCF